MEDDELVFSVIAAALALIWCLTFSATSIETSEPTQWVPNTDIQDDIFNTYYPED